MKKLGLGQWLAQYGERIGLGIALVIMLLLATWGLFSAGPGLKPDDISKTVSDKERSIRQGQPAAGELARYLPVSAAALESSLAEVGARIPTKALQADSRIGSQTALAGVFRRNPQVLSPLAPRTAPVNLVHTQFVIECERRNNQEECYTYVVKPKPGVKTPELKAIGKPDDPQRRMMELRLKQFQMLNNRGGMMGPGGPFGPGPGGPMGPIGPVGPAVGGGAEGSGPGGAAPPAAPNPVAVETQYEIARVPVTESSKYDLAAYLYCSEAIVIVSAFPYAEQMQEIADALLIDRQQVQWLFKGFEVEKRVFALGDRLRGIPDELVIWDRQNNQVRRVVYTADLPNKDELGWLPVNVQAAAFQVARAIEFEAETDPFWRVLIDHSRNLLMRLPRMLGSTQYPWKDLAISYPEIKATLDKIKANQKLYEKPPPVDPRLQPNLAEAFESAEVSMRGGGPMGGEGSDVGVPPAGGLGSGPAPAPVTPKAGGAAGSAPAGPFRGPAAEGPNQPAAPPVVVFNELPDYCLIRFLDIFDRSADLRFEPFNTGGRPVGVQYRIRIVLSNPNFGKTREVQRPEMAAKETLEGPWSPPSELLPLLHPTYVYAEVQRDGVKPSTGERPGEVVPLQIHRWLGLILDLVKRDSRLAVGDWVVGTSWLGRGEFVGQYTKLPLAVWAPHVPAEGQAGAGGADAGGVVAAAVRRFGRFVYVPEVATTAFATRSILVDFENRNTWNDHVRNKLGNSLTAPVELTPQEVLILTEDGRLIARNAQRDAADQERQQREKAWRDRLENSKNVPQPGAKPGGNLFGGS
ncbi:MAG: hypothetical protein RMJ19_03475 [Gemmatales bacterium]|nr:hypothetical protein [Gemmatales bacterium]MDW8174706.1 hypothetical protein [Gemmatales bacterium]